MFQSNLAYYSYFNGFVGLDFQAFYPWSSAAKATQLLEMADCFTPRYCPIPKIVHWKKTRKLIAILDTALYRTIGMCSQCIGIVEVVLESAGLSVAISGSR